MGQGVSNSSKPAAPKAPDYSGAAQGQTQANLMAGLTNWALNNANQNTSFGSKQVSFDANGNPTVNTSLNPADQARLDQQRALISGALGGSGGNLVNAMTSRLGADPGAGLPGMRYSVGDPSAIMSQTENAAFNQIMSRLNPQMQMQTDAQNTRISNMGGTGMSPAAMRANTNLNLSQQDAVRQAAAQAIGVGQTAAQQNFGMGLNNANLTNSGISQQFGQNVATQQLPLSQLGAILGMGTNVGQPTFQGTGTSNIAPGNQQTAAQNQGQFDLGNYVNQAGGWNSLLSMLGAGGNALTGGTGGIGGAIGSGIGAIVKAIPGLASWWKGLGGVDNVGGVGGNQSGGADLGGYDDLAQPTYNYGDGTL